MSFCCGTDMLLTIADIRYHSTTITNVPMLFCLACDQLIVHPDIELEFELLKDYAISDRTREVDLAPHISQNKQEYLYDPRNQAEHLRLGDTLKEHIDRALDLYSMAQTVDDPAWKEEVLDRLNTLQKKVERNQKH
ncbi:hypothetical protein [Ammoniphilus resinae]|uniref:Uncharacterized protein n=1 Tax=Ammoniphilus resinae TaxID=861532 RepID=A0ABS4GWT4_9BACL|nr:hypothetical protein [Ammoniphilus resinae]MBP1934492.1 hypothetical protein [Ammoniphilus resinae]